MITYMEITDVARALGVKNKRTATVIAQQYGIEPIAVTVGGRRLFDPVEVTERALTRPQPNERPVARNRWGAVVFVNKHGICLDCHQPPAQCLDYGHE